MILLYHNYRYLGKIEKLTQVGLKTIAFWAIVE